MSAERTLLQYCEADDLHGARLILEPHLSVVYAAPTQPTDEPSDAAEAAEDAKDQMLSLLFEQPYEGHDTPVEVVLRRSGEGATCDSRLRLYFLDCLVACGPLSRFKRRKHPAWVKRHAPTMRRQVLMWQARLGALMRPYESLGETSTFVRHRASSFPDAGTT